LLHVAVEVDEKTDGFLFAARSAAEEFLHFRARRQGVQIRAQILSQCRVVLEGVLAGSRFKEEIERIDDRQLGHQVDRHFELAGFLGKHQSRQEIAVRVLLPINEMLLRLHAQRIRQHRRPAMRRRAQPHHLRRQGHIAVVAVTGAMVQGDMDRHLDAFPWSWRWNSMAA
jgi:hypothetical protein